VPVWTAAAVVAAGVGGGDGAASCPSDLVSGAIGLADGCCRRRDRSCGDGVACGACGDIAVVGGDGHGGEGYCLASADVAMVES
jgi:hypothetical protein